MDEGAKAERVAQADDDGAIFHYVHDAPHNTGVPHTRMRIT
jgi:hypothetical protein